MARPVQKLRGTRAQNAVLTLPPGVLVVLTDTGELVVHDGAAQGGHVVGRKNLIEVITPPQITASQNDYDPAGLGQAGLALISSNADRDVTGLAAQFAAGAFRRELRLLNIGAHTITLKDDAVASTAANRFLFGADSVLSTGQSATIVYDADVSRWRLIASTAGSPVADKAITYDKLSNPVRGALALATLDKLW